MGVATQISNELSTYRRLRTTIGLLAFMLPVLMLILPRIPLFETEMQPSISHFYYTNFRDLFTGTLCAVGMFMIRYKGFGNRIWWKNDGLLTNIAGIMAICVAFVPTNPITPIHPKIDTLIPYPNRIIGHLHDGFAGVLFLSIAILFICVFTLGQHRDTDTPKSLLDENNIYRFCGYGIILSIIILPIAFAMDWYEYSTLICESVALFLFGTSWLVKGRAFGDKGRIGRVLYGENNT